jgi:hypothetical protein
MRTAQPTSLCHNLPCSTLTKQPTTIFFYVLCSACHLLPYSSMHTAQLTTFCNIPSCTQLTKQPSALFLHTHISANNLLPYSSLHTSQPAIFLAFSFMHKS